MKPSLRDFNYVIKQEWEAQLVSLSFHWTGAKLHIFYGFSKYFHEKVEFFALFCAKSRSTHKFLCPQRQNNLLKHRKQMKQTCILKGDNCHKDNQKGHYKSPSHFFTITWCKFFIISAFYNKKKDFFPFETTKCH